MGWGSSVEQTLFERRILLVSGTLSNERGGDLAAALMTLDALGDDPVEIRLNAASDSLEAAFAVMDTIDFLGVAVHATVAGAVDGTAVGILAVCRRRRIGSLGRIRLREPRADLTGSATDLARAAADLENRWQRYVHRLAEAASQPYEHVEADLRAGRSLDASAALAYGLVDEIVGVPTA